MKPFEVIIPIVFFLFTFILLSKLIKNRHERKKWEYQKGQSEGDRSLTTSELQLMIDDAVARASLDLEARLERLERPRIEAPVEEDSTRKTLGRELAQGKGK